MSEFDSIMVRVEVGGSRKLRRFSAEERWCVLAGVWALAAKSPLRGYLLITEKLPVEVEDIAEQAGVKVTTARSTLKKMRDLGMLEYDDELKAEHVHDWHQHQPEPKASESREAWRERQRRKRDKDRQAGVTDVTVSRVTVTPDSRGTSHPLREEKGSKGKGTTPPTPPQAGGRKRDRDLWKNEVAAWVQANPPIESEQWNAILSSLAATVDADTLGLHIAPLHAHVDGDVLVIGVPEGRREWIEGRFGRLIGEAAGVPVQFVECGCELPARAAA